LGYDIFLIFGGKMHLQFGRPRSVSKTFEDPDMDKQYAYRITMHCTECGGQRNEEFESSSDKNANVIAAGRVGGHHSGKARPVTLELKIEDAWVAIPAWFQK
jgi:hypothetical protein